MLLIVIIIMIMMILMIINSLCIIAEGVLISFFECLYHCSLMIRGSGLASVFAVETGYFWDIVRPLRFSSVRSKNQPSEAEVVSRWPMEGSECHEELIDIRGKR